MTARTLKRDACSHFLWYNWAVKNKDNLQRYDASYQLKLSLEISKIIEISDPVYTFNEIFHHIDLKIPFSAIKYQLKQTAKPALFGKESCQRSWLRDWISKLFYSIFSYKITTQTNCKPALPVQGRVSA